jgi:hypothetical protein
MTSSSDSAGISSGSNGGKLDLVGKTIIQARSSPKHAWLPVRIGGYREML